ncbi:DUF6371 domain-containing protein [Cecembia lonarensis]|uniref:DUF6371 domain-containing protein n=1 Tax=Cecembia lonarensis (strain CCUG 58316 / KCTC 22772 / LW9) TaxID=1225176 RepID=K1L5J5_CECL9|nr:DUF6371 domain-containing protein [Cecembia lonarensis]EKB47287.1 hypothetical protein B879_04115 [Cecembia lonarensis LW9]
MEKLSFKKKRSKVRFCPCGKSNKDGKFASYEGYEDKGYCHSCDKHFSVHEEKTEGEEKGDQRPFTPPRPRKESFIESEYLEASLKGYDKNNFVQFLVRAFGEEKAMQAVKVYKVGTSKRWQGANIFWQIDHKHKIRSGKIMVYDSSTGKRQNKNSWVHSVLKLEDFDLNQCLFGSHLITSDHSKSIGIVESEKTAIIASILMPELIWLASGGKAGLKTSKVKFLVNRNIILFPDLSKPADKVNCYQLWKDTAKELKESIPAINIQVSDYLEARATDEEKSEGLDIADYFLKWEWENEGNEASKKPLFSESNIPNEENEENDHSQKPFFSDHGEIREFENQISDLSKEIFQAIQGIRERRKRNSILRNEIANCEISEKAILVNKELLKAHRKLNSNV